MIGAKIKKSQLGWLFQYIGLKLSVLAGLGSFGPSYRRKVMVDFATVAYYSITLFAAILAIWVHFSHRSK